MKSEDSTAIYYFYNNIQKNIYYIYIMEMLLKKENILVC